MIGCEVEAVLVNVDSVDMSGKLAVETVSVAGDIVSVVTSDVETAIVSVV